MASSGRLGVERARGCGPTMALIGEATTEFADLVSGLERLVSEGRLAAITRLPGLSAAAAARSTPPDIAVVLQSWPDQVTSAEVTAALNHWPLTRWVCCGGAWCASQGRTRNLWPAAIRVPLAEGLARIAWEIDVTAGRAAPQELTASADRLFAAISLLKCAS